MVFTTPIFNLTIKKKWHLAQKKKKKTQEREEVDKEQEEDEKRERERTRNEKRIQKKTSLKNPKAKICSKYTNGAFTKGKWNRLELK